jgi:hypothetical protein
MQMQTELFAMEILPVGPVPEAAKEELQTLLASLLLGVVRNRTLVLLTKEGRNDQDHD